MRVFVALFLAFFTFAGNVYAVENPKNFPNNKFGIHIIDENDLGLARDLVNSSGGDWGYATLVIREDERVVTRWQEVFNQMRRMHIIPIVRIASVQTPNGWEKPQNQNIDAWASFLNSLNWIVKNRYVIIGNEPNQAHEWGGEISPIEYGNYLKEFSKKLKNVSVDFYILPAGFDAAAPNSKTTMMEERFLTQMIRAHPDIPDYIDGWSSHSYPDPEKTVDSQAGRGTLRTYIWELDLLKKLGIQKNLQVFITETGWRHSGNTDSAKIAQNYKEALDQVWNDERIIAVTPFLLNYNTDPFLDFSWLNPSGAPYNFYYEVQKIPKTGGRPNQITDGVISGEFTFPIVQAGHGIYGLLIVENRGQSIWEGSEVGLDQGYIFAYEPIEPNGQRILFFKIQAPDTPGLYTMTLQLSKKGEVFGNTRQIYSRVFKFLSPLQFLRLI